MQKDVVIYRKNENDLLNTFADIAVRLEKENVNWDYILLVNRKRIYIRINNYYIDFFFGSVLRMGGTRPFLYNTDCKFASDFLEQGAIKVNGKEITDLEELLRIILEA